MKILYFGGGLGNQIFEYSFYLSLKDKYPNERIYGVYDKKRFKEHAGGFEAENIHIPQDIQGEGHQYSRNMELA